MLVKKQGQTGFTLLELMIVVVIVAILATIAIPSYQRYITRATRTKATQALSNLAGLEERYFYSNNTYTKTLSDLGIKSPYCMDACTDARYYNVTIPESSATNYLLEADPENTQKVQDTDCGNLTPNRAGEKKAALDPSNTKRCWGS